MKGAGLKMKKKGDMVMHDKALCEMIGQRIKQRRMELHLGQQYLAEKMDVNKSTIQRYETGAIDNSKKLILEGISDALHVSPEWLRGETEEYEMQVMDKRELQIGDTMTEILHEIHLIHADMQDEELYFSEDLLLLMLREYMSFVKNFKIANDKYVTLTGKEKVAREAGFSSEEELNETLFLRKIYHTTDTFREVSDIIRLYPKDSREASQRLRQLLGEQMHQNAYSNGKGNK